MEEKQRKALAKLADATKSGSTKKILSNAEKVLALLPDDPDAVKCKVIALIKSGKAADAIACINGSSHRGSLQYELAYAHFRNQQYQASLDIANTLPQDAPATKELTAQLYYRMENFQDAISLYSKLDKTPERRTNAAACYAASVTEDPHANVPRAVLRRKVDGFEYTYNKACICLAQGKYAEALDFLETAVKDYIALLHDEEPDISDEEVEQELAILRLQEGVARHRLGEEDAARALYYKAMKGDPDNQGIVAVAANNIVALNKDQNVFNSQHRMKTLTSKAVEAKLSSVQKRVVQFNRALLLLFSNDVQKCRDACAALEKQYPSSYTPTVIEAFSYLREKKVKNKADRLQAISDKHPENEVYALVLAQEYASKGAHQQTLSSLLRAGSLAYSPSFVGYVLALCERLNDPITASLHLESAIEHHTKNQTEDGAATLPLILRLQGEYKLNQGLYKDAVSVFRDLVDGDPEDPLANAYLILALARVNIDEAEKLSVSLPPMGLAEDIDVDELEQARKIRTQKAGMATIEQLATSTAAVGSAQAKKKKSRKRPGKPPKNPSPKGPDPERWLPKWQRAAYKAKKAASSRDSGAQYSRHNKKGRGKPSAVGSGTQGAADISEEEMKRLDAANRPRGNANASKKAKPKGKGKGKRAGKRR